MKYLIPILLCVSVSFAQAIRVPDPGILSDGEGVYMLPAVPKRPLIVFSEDGEPLSILKDECPKQKGDYVRIYNQEDMGKGLDDPEWEAGQIAMCQTLCQFDVNGKLKGLKK